MILFLAAAAMAVAARGEDWPQWAGRADRNMVSAERGLPESFEPASAGRRDGRGPASSHPAGLNVKWAVPLGTHTWSTPAVAGGRVYIGTNNGAPRDPKYKGDYGILLCLKESDGSLLWQLAAPHADYQDMGIVATPTIEGDRVYVVTGRAEVLCLDAKGLADGNDGPFTDEAAYLSQPPWGRKPPEPSSQTATRASGPPFALGPTDADIIWRFDMRSLWVQPHDVATGSVLIRGQTIFVSTSNGVGNPRQRIANSTVPSLIALDKKTGKLLAGDDEHIGRRMFHTEWSQPAMAAINGKDQIAFGGADGWLYGFDPEIDPNVTAHFNGPGKTPVIRKLWSLDCNPPEYVTRDGKPIPYRAKEDGPCEVIATPVFHGGLVYTAIGQDPEHGTGKGALWCLDPSKIDDQGRPAVVWCDKTINRSDCTVAIADGLLYIGDRAGDIHCKDATTGREIWTHSTGTQLWSSTLVADGKVYIGGFNGHLYVLAAGREKKLLADIDTKSRIFATPVAANGVLYIAAERMLYAVAKP